LEDIDSGTAERRLLASLRRDVEKFPVLSREEENEVAKRYQQGDEESLNKLVEANIKFVISVAFEYWRPGLPLMDMISEGCIGLIEAVKRFDPDLGFRLLTYAAQAIEWRIIKVIKDFRRHEHDSLDVPVYEEEELTLKDMLISEETFADEKCFHKEISDFLFSQIHGLTDREKEVIRLRFRHDFTIDEVGLRIGVKRERIRQIEARALMKLKRAGRYERELAASGFVK